MAKKAMATAESKGPTIFDCVQGTQEWLQIKMGIPSASNFGTIMASGKDGGASVTRTKLLHRLAAELITGEPGPEGFRNGAMDKGNAMEAEARESYARRKKVDVRQVGFVTNFSGLKYCGASPDGLIGFDGGLEIKIATEAHVLIPLLQRPATMPSEHRAQIQGNIWVCERDWWDLTIYHHRAMPAIDVRVHRDEAFIRELSNEIERFNFDLKQLVSKLRAMGAAG